MSNKVIQQGWLDKMGKIVKNVKRRYCILFENLTISYFEQQPPAGNYSDSKGSVDLKGCQGICTPSTKMNGEFTFEIGTPNRVWLFASKTKEELDKWCSALAQLTKTDINHCKIVCSGYLKKKGAINEDLKRRHCKLFDNKCLNYCKDEHDVVLGVIDLDDAFAFWTPSLDDKVTKKSSFDIVCPDRTWIFVVDNEADLKQWTSSLENLLPENCPEMVTLLEGFLMKERSMMKNWRKRWCCITTKCFYYFESQKACERFKRTALAPIEDAFSKALEKQSKGVISLKSIKLVNAVGQFESCFAVETDERVYRFVADKQEEVIRWVNCFGNQGVSTKINDSKNVSTNANVPQKNVVPINNNYPSEIEIIKDYDIE